MPGATDFVTWTFSSWVSAQAARLERVMLNGMVVGKKALRFGELD